MIAPFVIGLREGLETVVVLGAIALFLIHQDRRHQLRVIWTAAGAAAVLCIVGAVLLRRAEVGLSGIAANRLEAVIDVAAVITVTYMVLWMRFFPRDLVHDTDSRAGRQLSTGSTRALAGMAFFVVLREGIEVSVFVLALEGDGIGAHFVGAIGAGVGVLLSVLLGVIVIRRRAGTSVSRFFRITAAVLVLTAAGLAMEAIHSANAGEWLVFAQTPRFDWSALAPPGTLQASVVTGLLGIQSFPTLIDVIVWLAYLAPMLLVVALPRDAPSRTRRFLEPRPRRLAVVSLGGTLAIIFIGGPVLRATLVSPSPTIPVGPPEMPVPHQGLDGGHYLLFRNTALGPDYGRLALVSASDPSGPRAYTSLSCDRVDFEGGRGLCLELPTSGLNPQTTATVFDSHFHVLHSVALTGLISRARVSPNGRYGAATTFVTGDSYAVVNTYSTRTYIIDMRTGKVVYDLSQLTVRRDGRSFRAVNFNFWGVTFTGNGQTFYATLGTGSSTYLIRADVRTRQATVIATNVECPSLSPDGREIAFKRRMPGSTVRWRLSVLDLATGQVHSLAETRSVDDQVEWLDNRTILYGVLQNRAIAAMNPDSAATPSLAAGFTLVTNTWSVPADGSGHPRLISDGTWSEVVTNR